MPVQSSVFYQPSDVWVGDVIPFEHEGALMLFYLRELREDPKPGTSWGLVTTRDLVTFEDHGVALPHGGVDDSDFNAYTGCVVADGDVHRLFYTGHNPRHLGPDGVTPLQLVMQAVSDDGMRTWTKRPELTFAAPAEYEPGDWRDPFVFRAGPDDPWRMVLAARHTRGPARRRGLIAQLVSTDLDHWAPASPFWDPRRYVTHECPDVFEWGGRWYLVYSEFSESFTTRYRIAESPDGPWEVPEHDTIDGRAFYAAKSIERDGRRFFCGWIASKDGSRDDGAYQWAGTMSILEATQLDDGSLRFHLPAEIIESFDVHIPFELVDPVSGTTYSSGESARLHTPDGYATAVTSGPIPSTAAVSVTMNIGENTTECGVLLRSSVDGDESYIVRLEPRRSRVVLDRWPRQTTGDMQWQASGDVPYAIELERPCRLEPGAHTIRLVMDGTLLVAVIDESVVLSARLYDRSSGGFGVFVGEGTATFHDLRMHTRGRLDHTTMKGMETQ